MAAEAANVHSRWLDEFPDDYPPRITELVLEGRAIPALDYLRPKAQQDRRRPALADDCSAWTIDACDHPRPIGPAPDPSTTGDPAFNSPWSFSGLPTVSFPIGTAVVCRWDASSSVQRS